MEVIPSKVVGTQFYPESKGILAKLKEGDELVLVREKDNEHDENAVAVYHLFVPKRGLRPLSPEIEAKTHPVKIKIGHINAYQAEIVAPIMDSENYKVKCIVSEITGHAWICPCGEEPDLHTLRCPKCNVHIRYNVKMKQFRGCNIELHFFEKNEKEFRRLNFDRKSDDISDDELETMLCELEEDL